MIKYIHIISIKTIGLLTFLFVIGACSDDIMDEIGKDPNNPTEVTSRLLISQTTLTTAFETNGNDLAWYSSVFVEHTVGVHGQLETGDKRTGINSSIGNNSWNSIYAGTLQDLHDVIGMCSEGGPEEGNNAALGIAKILTAFNFSVACDIWGEVPFTKTLQGASNRTPAFDSEETVYTGILALLDEAITNLGTESVGNPGEFDFYYGGDVDAWIAAAYALKARYLNRLSNVRDNDSEVLAAIANAFTSSADNMVFASYTDDATGQNPWFQEEVDRGHHAVSQTLDDILVSLNDPRRLLFFNTIDDGTINPAPPGTAETDQSGDIYSRINGNYLVSTSPQPIITYDEVKFIEAEAYFRSNNKTAAYDAYLEGISEAMMREGLDSTAIDPYLSQVSVAPGADNLTMTHIITQKYIAFWLFNPIEAYNDYRRTRIPTLKNTVGAAPERFPYPSDESATNPNVPSKGSTAKVWWAK